MLWCDIVEDQIIEPFFIEDALNWRTICMFFKTSIAGSFRRNIVRRSPYYVIPI